MNVGDQDGDGPADECHGECQQERWCHLVDKAGPATEDETFWHGKRVKKGFVHMFIVFNDCSVYLFWIIHYIILYFIILYYILLCHIALCYIILYNIVLYNIIYIYITLWYIYIYTHDGYVFHSRQDRTVLYYWVRILCSSFLALLVGASVD